MQVAAERGLRIDGAGARVMAILAHPDDCELLCAGTLARFRDDGAAIAVCCLCRGDRGQPDPPVPDLAARRREELAASARLLGAECFPGFAGDGVLFDSPETRGEVIDRLRAFRPTLVITHSPADYHPDHHATGRIVEACTWLAASPGHVTDRERLPRPPALWWADTIGTTDFQPHLWIDVSAHVELKHAMLACHTSQLARGTSSEFGPLDGLMRAQYTARGNQAGVVAAECFRQVRIWKRIVAF